LMISDDSFKVKRGKKSLDHPLIPSLFLIFFFFFGCYNHHVSIMSKKKK
jgi:hypothetical protein